MSLFTAGPLSEVVTISEFRHTTDRVCLDELNDIMQMKTSAQHSLIKLFAATLPPITTSTILRHHHHSKTLHKHYFKSRRQVIFLDWTPQLVILQHKAWEYDNISSSSGGIVSTFSHVILRNLLNTKCWSDLERQWHIRCLIFCPITALANRRASQSFLE